MNWKNGANFVTIKLIKVNDLPDGQYSVYMSIRFKTAMLRSDFYDYIDVYIFVEGKKTIEDRDRNNQAKRKKKSSRIMLHLGLGHEYQKSITLLFKKQKLKSLCQCIIC